MRFFRIAVPALLALLVWMPLATGRVYAADDGPVANTATTNHQLACEDGVCSLRVDLGEKTPSWLPASGFALSVLEENLKVLPDGAGISVSDGLSIHLPTGNLKLADAEIRLSMGADGQVESFYGTAALPTPTLGIFSRGSSSRPISTAIGFDFGSSLPSVAAELDPDRKYLFFDLGAGTELQAEFDGSKQGALTLSIPEGQRATVVIDPAERFAYIDGNVTLRYSGSIAFLTQLLDPAETVDLFSGELPLRHRATVHFTGVVSQDLADSHLEFAGRYAVDGGQVAEWLNIDGEPLAFEGGILINDEGLLGTGIVHSSVLPESVWDSAVQAQVFVPFSMNPREAYASLDTNVQIPFADISADGYARLDGALEMMADGSLQVPWRTGETATLAASGDNDGDVTGAKLSVGELDSGGSRWAKVWDRTADGALVGIDYARRPASAAYGWMKDTADVSYESAAGGLEWTVGLATSRLCETTGYCGRTPSGDEEPATAMR